MPPYMGMTISDTAPSSLRQALPSSVMNLLSRAVPQHMVPAPPLATLEQCQALAGLFKQECMRREAGEGWTLTPARNGACEPPNAAAIAQASGAVQACGPQMLVQLGTSPALEKYASVSERLALGWAAIIALPLAADVTRFANANPRHARVVSTAESVAPARSSDTDWSVPLPSWPALRLHHAAVCAEAAAARRRNSSTPCLDVPEALVGLSRRDPRHSTQLEEPVISSLGCGTI